ncbi:MAG: type II toxin-antitoxin system Phd/YefM family antitoxin [Candidatus Gracilibacteria bacterium]
MKLKNIMAISQARKNIFAIAAEVQKPETYYILTENGKPKAVIMSADEFESWRETVETLAEMPNLPKKIKKFEEDIKSGKHKNYPSLNEVSGKTDTIGKKGAG